MARRGVVLAVGAVVAMGAAGVGVTSLVGGEDDAPSPPTRAANDQPPGQAVAFVDAHDTPPANWPGPVFRLSQDYPAALPGLGEAPWRQIDFRTQSHRYLAAVLDYALDGNTAVDFRGQDNTVRPWFHAPWMHFGEKGREFIHGLTSERRSRPKELAPTQTEPARNWAVSLYNPRGGFVLGQVWRNHDQPDPKKAAFPEGTVAFKLLLTTASLSQVPFLKGSMQWEADIDRARGNGPRPKLRLLQIDVAIRDRRADDTTGWVFGTFIYNGDAPGDTVWERMVPIGVMWGNDPDRLAEEEGPLRETVINPDARPVIQHLGRGGRLNGPVDNPVSSCMSCHSTAQIPPDLSRPTVPGVLPNNASQQVIEQYFRNIKAQTPFTPGQLSLDYSLQLQSGISNWAQARAAPPGPPTGAPAAPSAPLRVTDDVEVSPIVR